MVSILRKSGGFIYKTLTNQYSLLFYIFILLSIVSFQYNMGTDEGVWSYIGRVWVNEGIPPYTGALDNKPIGILCVFAFANLFKEPLFTARLLAVIALSCFSFTLFLACRLLSGKISGILAMVLSGLTMCWQYLDSGLPPETESFMVLFSSLSFYLIIKAFSNHNRWFYLLLFLSGCSIGFASAFKQVALFTFAGLTMFHFFMGKNQLKKTALGYIFILCGFSISVLLTLIPLILSGVSIVEYWNNVWLILFANGKSSINPSVKSRLFGFIRAWKSSGLILFYPFIFLFFIRWKHLILNKIPVLGILLWLLFDFVGANISGYYYGHHFKQVVPSFCVISAISLTSIIKSCSESENIMRRYYICLFSYIFILWFPYEAILNTALNRIVFPKENGAQKLGQWLNENTSDKDYIYILGNGTNSLEPNNQVLFYSGRLSASKYFNPFFINLPGALEDVSASILTKKPKFILIPKPKQDKAQHPALAYLKTMVDGIYTFHSEQYDYDIYEIK